MALLRLKPTADSVANMGASVGTDLYAVVDEPWNTTNPDLDFIATGNTVVLGNCLLEFDDLPATTPMVINSVSFLYRHYNPTPGGAPIDGREFRSWVKSGATSVYGTITGYDGANDTAYYRETYTLDPDTGLSWTSAGVNALLAGVDEPNWYPVHGVSPGDDPRYSHMYLEVDYTPRADQIEQVREDLARRLLQRERGRALVEIDADLLFLDAEIGSIIWVSDPTYVDSTGAELGVNTWERRPMRLLSVEVDPQTFRAKLLCRDLRDGIQLRRLWDTMVSNNVGPFADGVARLGNGGVRTYTRASLAYVRDRALQRPFFLGQPDQIIRQIEPSFEAFDIDGELIESARTNVVLNSAFALGATSWTLTNAALDTTALAWDVDLTPNSVKLSPTGAAVASIAPSAAYGGGALTGKRTISVGLKNDDVNGVGIIILRSGGGSQYWNAGTQLWQAGTVTNALVTTEVNTFVGQDRLTITYDLGAGAYSVTPTIVTLSNDVANTANIYDVQDEAGSWATSNILTTSASATRAVASLFITQPTSDKACWPNAHGQAYIEVAPQWSAAKRATGYAYVLALDYDANNGAYLRWNGASARWEFALKVAGVATIAYLAASPVRGTTTKLLIQWTGTEEELGLAAYTQRIYVDDVQGTDAVSAAAPTAVYTSSLYIGSDSAGANQIDAVLSNLIVCDIVSPAAEVARFPLP
jgi:hypothetical protein